MTKDTHGQQGEGWVGFDLDGTLAKYDGWKGIDDIGAPIGPMVERIKKLHADGVKVKILTARVAPRPEPETKPNPYLENHWCVESPDDMPWALKGPWTALEFIQDWCWKSLGFVPEITHEKNHLMLELYDDQVKQVIPNLGYLVEDIAASKRVVLKVERVEYVNCKWVDRIAMFCIGIIMAATVLSSVFIWKARSMPDAVKNLGRAVQEYQESRMKHSFIMMKEGGQ